MTFASRHLAAAALVATTLFWAGNLIAARSLVDVIPPVTLSFWRWIIACVLLAPFAVRPMLRDRATLRQHLPLLSLLALLSAVIFNTLLYVAAHTTTAVNIGLINATMPLAIGLMAWLILREQPGPAQALGLVVALPGTVLIVSRGDPLAAAQLGIQTGDLLMLLAVCAWGLYSILLRRVPAGLHPVSLLMAVILLALPMMAVAHRLELAAGATLPPMTAFTPNVLATLFYVGLFPSILSYLGWNYGIRVLGPVRASLFVYLIPVFSALLALTLLDERLQGYHATGGLLILAGLWLASRPRTPVPRTAPS